MSREKTNCKKICDLLAAYLDGETTAEERGYIDIHMEECPQCRRELETLRFTQAGLREIFMARATNAEPSLQAWSHIKAQIEEEERRPSGFSRWLNRNLIWQVSVAAAGIVIIIFAASVWQFGGMNSAPTTKEAPAAVPAPAAAPRAPEESMPSMLQAPSVNTTVSASVQPGLYSNSYGDTIHIEAILSNNSAQEVTLASYPPAVRILDPLSQETVRSFSAGTSTLVLEPGQTATNSYEWDQKNDRGEQVPYGYYYIEPDIILEQEKESFTHGAGPAEVLILPEGGVMEKTLVIDAVQTTGEMQVTLKRVEMTATNTHFVVSTTIPLTGTAWPDDAAGGSPPPPPPMIKAQYQIDDGPVRDIGYAEIGISDDGTELIWAQPYIGPVPLTAHTLTVIMTATGEQEGRWEFKVPLT